MWYEKRFNPVHKVWWVYRCTEHSCVLVKTFKTEKIANKYIQEHGR